MESVSHCQKQTFPSAPVETMYRMEPFTIGLNYKGGKKKNEVRNILIKIFEFMNL